MKLRGMFAFMNFANGIALAGSYLGIDSYVNISRNLHASSAAQLHDPAVTTKDTKFEHVRVRIYQPTGRTNVLPGIMYYHGGGWTFGSIELYDWKMLILCKETNTVVVSVEYRLAPEHPFPVPFEDCVSATKYFLNNAAKFKVDPNRIAAAGDSAGGHLAAAVSLKLRDENFTPAIRLQVLIYPALQMIDFGLPSHVQNYHGPVIPRWVVALCTESHAQGTFDNQETYCTSRHVLDSVKLRLSQTHLNVNHLPSKYLKGYARELREDVETGDQRVWQAIKGKMLNPYYSPLVAESVAGLPPAYIFSAEYDPLRDDSFLYAHRLREAGVEVTHVNDDIGFHWMMMPQFGMQENLIQMCAFIKGNL